MILTIERIIGPMSDADKAQLAAEILNEVDPRIEHIELFFRTLTDSVHDELLMRAEEEEQRD
jgi:hypothetical protein